MVEGKIKDEEDRRKLKWIKVSDKQGCIYVWTLMKLPQHIGEKINPDSSPPMMWEKWTITFRVHDVLLRSPIQICGFQTYHD